MRELLLLAGTALLFVVTFIGWRKWEAHKPGRANRRVLSRWAKGNGFTHREKSRLLPQLHGWPFDPADPVEHGLLVGALADRPALVLHFAWQEGLRGCVAVVIELPRQVPSLLVSSREPGTPSANRVELESVEFNAAFQVYSDQPRFAYDAVHPRMMRFLLDNAHHGVRLDGTVLVVWEEGRLGNTRQLDAMTAFARDFYRHLPSYIFRAGYWRLGPHQNTLRVGKLGASAFGVRAVDERPRAPLPVVDVPRALRTVGYGARYVEIEEILRLNPGRDSVGREIAAGVVVEACWPPFELDDAASSPDPAFRRLVLADLGDWWAADWRSGRCGIRLEWLADRGHGRVTAFARGDEHDEELVELLCGLASDVADRLSGEVYAYRASDEPVKPVPPPPAERVDPVRELSASALVDAEWPELELTSYELLREQHGTARADRPAQPPTGHELLDVMFETRCADERFRGLVLGDLAGWLPLDDRTWNVAIRLSGGRLTVRTWGRVTEEERLGEVLREVRSRLSDAVLAYRP
jgi:hypothetical protein